MISKRMIELVSKNSAIREMFEEGNRLANIYGRENVFDFSLGNPTVETPSEVKKQIVEVLENNKPLTVHGYMPNAGFRSVRAAVAKALNERFNMNYEYSHIVMVVGAAGGLNCVLQSILNLNDEVIVCAPFFVEYGNYINNWGGKMVIANTSKETFLLDKDNIDHAINENTKAIIINNPNNPTGVVYDEENIKTICDLLKKKEKEYGHPIYIISDEPYRELVYDDLKVPYIPSFYKDTFVVYSWSKSLSLPGERIGYIAITPDISDEPLLLQTIPISNRIIGFVNSPSLIQLAVEKCLDIEIDLNTYNRNREYLYNHLIKIGYECVKPRGAFYLWVKTPIDEKVFVEMAKKERLLLVPGSSFYGPGYVRIAYCTSFEQIQKSISVFKRLFNHINE